MGNEIITVNRLSKQYHVRTITEGNIIKRIFSKKKYKEIDALNDVSFSIQEGQYVGVIGNNGAGKSTLIKLLTGILYPTAGQVSVMGRNPFNDRIKNNRNIGVVFGQKTQLKWDLSPLESYDLLKTIYGIDDETYKENIKKFVGLFEMEDFINNPVRSLSLGQRMKCEIAAAFLHNPSIVFLDEPTIGLDVFSKDSILRFLRSIKEESNATLILTTHDLEEMNRICDRLIIIDKGRTIEEDSIEHFTERFTCSKSIVFCIEGGVWKDFNPIDNEVLTVDNGKVFVSNVRKERVNEIISLMLANNTINDVQIIEPNFTEIVKKRIKEGY